MIRFIYANDCICIFYAQSKRENVLIRIIAFLYSWFPNNSCIFVLITDKSVYFL